MPKAEYWLKDGRVNVDSNEEGRTEITIQDTPHSDLVFWDTDYFTDEYLQDFFWSETKDERAREVGANIHNLTDLLAFIEEYAPQLAVSDFYAILFGSHEDFEPAEGYPANREEWVATLTALESLTND